MKTTEELMNRLRNSRKIEEYLTESAPDMTQRSLPEELNFLLVEKGLTKSEVAHRSNMFENYVYKIFAGQRFPDRDKALCLCFGLGLDLTESRRLLRIADCGDLSPKLRRDSAIIFALKEHMNLMGCNELLYELGEQTL